MASTPKPKPKPKPKATAPDKFWTSAQKYADNKYGGILQSIDIKDKAALAAKVAADQLRAKQNTDILNTIKNSTDTAVRDIENYNSDTAQSYKSSLEAYSQKTESERLRRAAVSTAGQSALESQMKHMGLSMDGGSQAQFSKTLDAQSSLIGMMEQLQKGSLETQALSATQFGQTLKTQTYNQGASASTTQTALNGRETLDANRKYDELNTAIDAERLVRQGEKKSYADEMYEELKLNDFNQRMKEKEIANQAALADKKYDLDVAKHNEVQRHNQAQEAVQAAAQAAQKPKGESEARKYLDIMLKKAYGFYNNSNKELFAKGSKDYIRARDAAQAAFQYITTTGMGYDAPNAQGVMQRQLASVNSAEWEKFIRSGGSEIDNYLTDLDAYLMNPLRNGKNLDNRFDYSSKYGYGSIRDMLKQALLQYSNIRQGKA